MTGSNENRPTPNNVPNNSPKCGLCGRPVKGSVVNIIGGRFIHKYCPVGEEVDATIVLPKEGL